MSLIEKAKVIVKESRKNNEKKKHSPMEELLRDPEVKKTARYLVKHMSQTEAREVLNRLLEEEDRLPKTRSGKTMTITYQRFKTLLPKKRVKKTEGAA